MWEGRNVAVHPSPRVVLGVCCSVSVATADVDLQSERLR